MNGDLAQALMTMGFGLLGAPKGRELERFGKAGLLSLADYNERLREKRRNEIADVAMRRENLQMEQIQAQMAAAAQQQAGYQGAIRAATQPGSPEMGPPSPGGLLQPATPPTFDPQVFAQQYQMIDPVRAQSYLAGMAKDSPFDKPKPESWTPESLAEYAQTRNPAVLKRYEPPGEMWVDTAPPPGMRGQHWQVNTKTGQKRAVGSTPQPAPVTNVSLPPMESEEQKSIGKSRGEAFTGIIKNATTQRGKVETLAAMDSLLKNVNTTALTPIGMTVAGAARGIGLELDPQLPQKQAAEAISNKLALAERSTADGGGMPGAMSDADRNFLQKSVPNLSQTPQGRAMLIEINRRLAARAQEVATLANEYRKQKGTFDEGFGEYVQRNVAAKPLFADLVPAAEATGKRWVWNGKRLEQQ